MFIDGLVTTYVNERLLLKSQVSKIRFDNHLINVLGRAPSSIGARQYTITYK